MKKTIYELVQMRKQLMKELEELREERREHASEKVRIEDKDKVTRLKLDEYAERTRALMQTIISITVELRKKNVTATILQVRLTPEEVRIRRDMLDKEIQSLRDLKESKDSLWGDGRDLVRVSRIERTELHSYVSRLAEERGKLDAALQKFNLTEEVEVVVTS